MDSLDAVARALTWTQAEQIAYERGRAEGRAEALAEAKQGALTMPEPTIREQAEQLLDDAAQWDVATGCACMSVALTMAALSPLLERVEQKVWSMQATIDLLSDSDEVRGIAAGMADIKAGRVSPIQPSFESELRRRVEGLDYIQLSSVTAAFIHDGREGFSRSLIAALLAPPATPETERETGEQ